MPDIEPPRSTKGPDCTSCSTPMVIAETWPHQRLRLHEWRTYLCPSCADVLVLSSPVIPG